MEKIILIFSTDTKLMPNYIEPLQQNHLVENFEHYPCSKYVLGLANKSF